MTINELTNEQNVFEKQLEKICQHERNIDLNRERDIITEIKNEFTSINKIGNENLNEKQFQPENIIENKIISLMQKQKYVF